VLNLAESVAIVILIIMSSSWVSASGVLIGSSLLFSIGGMCLLMQF